MRSPTWGRGSGLADQPRVRGEQHVYVLRAVMRRGSAPRARGADDGAAASRVEHRISPACAGSRTSTTSSRAGAWDQPRVRGEQWSMFGCRARIMGSAPRARGAGAERGRQLRPRRISPACAGSRRALTCTTWSSRDQPRVRGEQVGVSSAVVMGSGSAPRARGAVGQQDPGVGEHRISPACAGSRRSMRPRITPSRDQPRVRGEQGCCRELLGLVGGSAPRARGAGRSAGTPPSECRISPACAGSRSPRRPSRSSCWDQPRVRGEQPSTARGTVPSPGSAPRARGAD